MRANLSFLVVLAAIVLARCLVARSAAGEPEWTIYVTNDCCPDYTWGLTETQTRQAFADIVRGHLDEMTRTDTLAPRDQDRYNAAVTMEAVCFLERYPDRKDELIRRIREGRLYVSPFLCNTLWGMLSLEGNVRSLMPARRLERQWGVRIDVAEHIEEPSLPWGMATILSGCGVRWLSVPYYGYDSTFGGLKTPPLFLHEGPDGSTVRVVMDRWACGRSSYTQGAQVLRDTKGQVPQWVEHYRRGGSAYPPRAVLASGTHGDIAPHSGGQAAGFADAVRKYNAQPGRAANLFNAALPQFCRAVDEAQKAKPFLPTVRGCFGHSWDLWPVCLAKYVADMREGERQFLAAEALVAVASLHDPKLAEATRPDRERAEWCLAMLGDHAWNGTGDANKRHNADLRRAWAAELNAVARKLQHLAWQAAGLDEGKPGLWLFNPLSFPRMDLVRFEATPETARPDAQIIEEDGRQAGYLLGSVPAFGFAFPMPRGQPPPDPLRSAPSELEGTHYRLRVDEKTGGIASLVHKPSGKELVAQGKGRGLSQSVYHDGQEHALSDVKSKVVAVGPILARLRITGKAAGIEITNLVALYDQLDRVDFDIRIKKPTTTKQERLCQLFPLLGDGAVVRIETPGAVIRPNPQPAGDLLPGADTRRFAVQGFLDVSLPDGPGVTIAPLDAFMLRTDLGVPAFECLGNDQNYREVVRDQHGVTEFRFRYALRAHKGPYDQAEAIAWSRGVANPLLAALGRAAPKAGAPPVTLDPARAIATCLKPAEDGPAGSCALRIWETAGKPGPVEIAVNGFTKAVQTDLLERTLKEVPIRQGKVAIEIRPLGLAAVRLEP